MWAEFVGYLACVLTFVSFYGRSMVTLRWLAIASNVSFITYAVLKDLTPVYILHSILLPLNVLRLRQIFNLVQQMEKAAIEDFSIGSIVQLMRRRTIKANETLFALHEPADVCYFVTEGTFFLPEYQKEIGPNSWLGEIALFTKAGRRTASAIALTDCTLMALSRKDMYSALLTHPQLAIHFIRLMISRPLHNSGDDKASTQTPLGERETSAKDPAMGAKAPRSMPTFLAIGGAILLGGIAISEPLWITLNRDAVMTTWANITSAPIEGTIGNLEIIRGQQSTGSAPIATIENFSLDRSAIIHAEEQLFEAEKRVSSLVSYQAQTSELINQYEHRRLQYADGFRNDLNLREQQLARSVTFLEKRVALSDKAVSRKQSLLQAQNASEADLDAARSSNLELYSLLVDASKRLERVRRRQFLAEQGIFLQEDGKEPEWSWRSLDETHLEANKTVLALREAEARLQAWKWDLARERTNFGKARSALIEIPKGMTIWSMSVSNGMSVIRGQRLFTWIDCSKLLADVPVSDTTASLLTHSAPAELYIEGEQGPRKAFVVMIRSSSAQLQSDELVINRSSRKDAAQIIIALSAPHSVHDCPIGRPAYVTFPEIGPFKYLQSFFNF